MVPGKQLMVGTRYGLYPSGIYLFKIENGQCKSKVNYWHQDLHPFYFSEDGTKLFSGYSNVFSLPEYDPNRPYSANNLSTLAFLSPKSDTEYHPIKCLVHSQQNQEVYLSHNPYSESGNSKIEVYNHSSYSLINQFDIEPVIIQQNINFTIPKYMFISKDNSSMWLLKVVKDESGIATNQWILDQIKIK